MPIAGYDDGLFPSAVTHSSKLAWWVVMRNVARIQYIKSLFQIHTSTERFVPRTSKNCYPQFRLCIIPFP